MFRLVLGVAVAMTCALAVSYVAGCILAVFARGEADWRDGALIAWGASLFVIPSIVVLTVPLHWLAIKLRRTRGNEYALVGALVGIGTFLIVQLLASRTVLEFPEQMLIPGYAIAPLVGAAASGTFWAVVRPDRSPSS